jgi:hypothetical protein
MVGMPVGRGISDHNFRAVQAYLLNDPEAVLGIVFEPAVFEFQIFSNGDAHDPGCVLRLLVAYLYRATGA